MSVLIRLASLSLLSLLLSHGATATAQYRVESWTADDGLLRFDGVRFTVFDKSNTGGLRTNRFTSLYEDRHGSLWLGTRSGLRDGRVTNYAQKDGVPRPDLSAPTTR